VSERPSRVRSPGQSPIGRASLVGLAEVPVSDLGGVGARRARALEELGVRSVADLLLLFPRRHVDRSVVASIGQLDEGARVTVSGVVEEVGERRARNGRSFVECRFRALDSQLRVVFFNQPWQRRRLVPGTEASLFGVLERFGGRPQMTNPLVDLLGEETGGLMPVYPASEQAGLESRDVARAVRAALGALGVLDDPLPEALCERLKLPTRDWAVRNLHFPADAEAARRARRRLLFDEVVRAQSALALARQRRSVSPSGLSQPRRAGGLVDRLLDGLPFELTAAQRRVVDEIAADMGAPTPMRRLLQGDVGSGKTLVALLAMLLAVDGGAQAAMLVPTEVLAEQHLSVLRAFTAGLEVDHPGSLLGRRPLRVELLSLRVGGRARERLLGALAAGEVDIVVGTHALLSDPVRFKTLGLVVVDEQHRFGVDQRARLAERAAKDSSVDPDLLVMSATPIPRTAALVVFGDLDSSVLDELPPGRQPVTTYWVSDPSDEQRAWQAVRDAVRRGEQAFVVCPLVEESDRLEAPAATAERDRLADGPLAGLRVGLVHGQMAASQRDQTMEAFRAGQLDVLVATTVIEVGVDVPNATVIVVEGAARFGLAQLHQLRGRIGRSSLPGECWLLGEASDDVGRRRLEALVEIADGFRLAEVDLELRGAGTLLGARQRGPGDQRLAAALENPRMVQVARDVARSLVEAEPDVAATLATELLALAPPGGSEYLERA